MGKKEDLLQIKLAAFKAAVDEALHQSGTLGELDSLFGRSEVLFKRAVSAGMLEWGIEKKEAEVSEEVVEEQPPEPKIEPVDVPAGKKQCPKCGDVIPEGWKKHSFRADGSTCGHTW